MTLYLSTGFIAASGGAAAKPGMVLLTPTSIAHAGTSASIGANGQVTFTAVTSLSLNGVFTADFDNYVVSMRANAGTGSEAFFVRLRTSGTSASGTNYTTQEIHVYASTVTAQRYTSATSMRFAPLSGTLRSGSTGTFYGPYLAQPTALRSVNITGDNNAEIYDYAATHSLSTSYDGVEFIASGSSMTGALQVYGVRS
jgi:hypothetical protein